MATGMWVRCLQELRTLIVLLLTCCSLVWLPVNTQEDIPLSECMSACCVVAAKSWSAFIEVQFHLPHPGSA